MTSSGELTRRYNGRKMGNRRMISKTVTQTQRFLRLPLEAQALYFHLIQNSDDDGVVEAFPVVRMIGVSEDSLGLLIVKDFIRPLNDEMVYFIVDFHEQNKVRADRKVNSVYVDLLREVVPDIELTEPRQRVDRPKKPPEKVGQPRDSQRADMGQQNISKDNISKYKSVEDSRSKKNSSTAEISNYYQKRIGVMDGQQYQILTDYLTLDGMELDAIKIAIDKAADNGKRSFSYINSILKNWRQNGIRTMVQVEDEQRLFQQKKQGQSDDDIQDPFIY